MKRIILALTLLMAVGCYKTVPPPQPPPPPDPIVVVDPTPSPEPPICLTCPVPAPEVTADVLDPNTVRFTFGFKSVKVYDVKYIAHVDNDNDYREAGTRVVILWSNNGTLVAVKIFFPEQNLTNVFLLNKVMSFKFTGSYVRATLIEYSE